MLKKILKYTLASILTVVIAQTPFTLTYIYANTSYNPSIPKVSAGLTPNDITNPTTYSPINLNQGFTIIDHVGVKDTAFNGERHIATTGKGIHWFGYDIPPYNDMILTNQDIPENYNINLKQTSIVADWHTINGSGVIFNATTSAPPNQEVPSDSGYIFKGYALVATQSKIQLRKYNTTIQNFSQGKEDFEVIAEIPKACESQSFNITKVNNTYTLKLDDILIFEGELEPIGNHVGAMVDYLEHNCNSLSSVYMYNLTVNNRNLFQTKEEV